MNDFDKNENLILESPERYLIFLDEVGDPFLHGEVKNYDDPSLFPVMTVSALIVSRAVYKDVLMPGLDEIKEYFFKDRNIYFHSREIRRKDGIFKIFLNVDAYSDFKMRMDQLLERSSVALISSSINKIKLLEKAKKFEQSAGTKYNIGDIYLRNVGYVLERVGHFLKSDDGKVIFEARGKTEGRRIQAVLRDARDNGTFYCDKNRFSHINEKIMFFTKLDNVNGLQLIDYCAYPFARHAKNPFDGDNKFFEMLRQYIYKGSYGEYGLKEWP